MTLPSSGKTEIRIRILIVEDDILMRRMYESLFKRHAEEFAWELRPSVEEALEHLHDRKFDAAILDWELPGINGLQLLKAIRSNPATKALPVIIASGQSTPAHEALALKHGANAYLAKPFDTEKLLDYLRGFGRRWCRS